MIWSFPAPNRSRSKTVPGIEKARSCIMFARRLGRSPLIKAWIFRLRSTKSPIIPSASLPLGSSRVLCLPISIASAWWLDNVRANARTMTPTVQAIRMDRGIRRLKRLIRSSNMFSFFATFVAIGCPIALGWLPTPPPDTSPEGHFRRCVAAGELHPTRRFCRRRSGWLQTEIPLPEGPSLRCPAE